MDVLNLIPTHTQDEVNPQAEGDYIGEDGLLYCGKCHTKKQTIVKWMDGDKVFPVICRCESEKREQEQREREREEMLEKVRRLKQASMMSSVFFGAKFEAYQSRQENEQALKIAQNYVKKWEEMKKQNQGLILYGTVGTGKSFTAACIANALLEQSVEVIMTSFVKILQDIQHIDDEGEYVKRLNRAELLIIDDLGAERNTDYALEKVYNIIDSRVRIAKPMILTTNLDIKEMQATTDIRYGRIYDRIFEVCFPVGMFGKSFRLTQAADRYMQTKAMLTE